MLKKIVLPVLAAVLLTLACSAPVQAWGGYHYAYRYGPYGYNYGYRYGPAFRAPMYWPYYSYNYSYTPYSPYWPYEGYYYGGVRYGYAPVPY
jgi:hypothetical protein